MPADDSPVIPATITIWAGIRHAQGGRRVSLGWDELCDWLSPVPPPPFQGEDGQEGWSPATFAHDHRTKANIELVYHLTLEHDSGTVGVELALAILRNRGWSCVLITTKSHTPERHRWRLVIRLSRPVSAIEREALYHFATTLGLDLAVAESRDPSRFWFTTCAGPHPESGKATRLEGAPLDVDAVLASIAASPPPSSPAPERPPILDPAPPGEGTSGYVRTALEKAARDIATAPPGTRHTIATAQAFAIGGLVGGGYLDMGEAARVLSSAIQPSWSRETRDETERTIRGQLHEGAKKPRTVEAPKSRRSLQPAQRTPATNPETPVWSSAMPSPTMPPTPPKVAPRLRLVSPDEKAETARFQRGDHLELAHALLDHIAPDKPDTLAYDEGAMYRYIPDAGLWRELDKSTMARGVHTFAGLTVAGKRGLEALKINSGTVDGAIDQAQHITRRVDFFADAPVGLAFSDGFVHARPDGLQWAEHSPDHRARVGYLFPCRECSGQPVDRWLTFLRSVWPVVEVDSEGNPLPPEQIEASEEDQRAKIRLLRQFLGACLVGVATKYQLCLVLVGEGSNGKSTLIKTVEALFPARSVAHVAPQDLGDEYRLALLAGKRFNTVGELPTTEIMASERFKAIVAGDEVTARQIRQEPITFQPRAGHLYAANRLPPVADMSHGFWSRFVVLRFAQVFPRGKNAREIWKEMVDAEGPAIIGWMLDGAADVLAAGGYTLPASSHAEIVAWRKKADTVASFLDECCDLPVAGQKRDDFWTQASVLFAAYSKWADDSKLKGVGKHTFADRMADHGYPQKRTATMRFYQVNLKRIPQT